MDEPQSLDAELMQTLVVEMLRLGVIPPRVLEEVERHFEAKAKATVGSSTSDRYDRLSAMTVDLQLQSAAPRLSDFQADRKRRQLRIVPQSEQ